jgi:hypothetical protein
MQALSQPPYFDFFILFSCIVLQALSGSLWLGNRNEDCIDDLHAMGLEPLGL